MITTVEVTRRLYPARAPQRTRWRRQNPIIATHSHASPDPVESLVAMALHIPRYCRAHPAEALAMTLHRQSHLVTATTGELRATVERINDEVYGRYSALGIEHWGELTELRYFALRMGCVQGPYGMVRPFCGTTVPQELDDVVEASARAILALG